MHDMSKFSPMEFGGYANSFFNSDGTRKGNPTKDQVVAFERAWCHHGHRNDHHWTYWKIGTHYTMNEESVVMPTTESIKEMAADMIGANAAQGNLNPYEGARTFYSKNYHRIILHPDARSLLEKELDIK
jgi:hypothetical protein